MQAVKQDDLALKGLCIERVFDHLVDALGGEPGSTLRRAVLLVDIDEHPHTTQAEIMQRLDIDKSSLNRDIEWLYDYGCIRRDPSSIDGREKEILTCGYSKKNLDFALEFFDFSHKNLQNFLNSLINLFGEKKPTLRDAKIVVLLGNHESLTRQEIFDRLYNGPSTTDNRAVNNLINFGAIHKKSDGNDNE